MKQITEPFEELIIPRRELQASAAMIYRVYSDYKNFELVEAASALEALSSSKNRNVYKIQRHDPLGDNVIHLSQVMNKVSTENIVVENNFETIAHSQGQGSEPVMKSAPEEIVTPEVASAAPASTEAAPLSNDDIDKLLNG